MTNAIIRKVDLALQLGITKGRVSQLITAGLPVRADGKLDRNAALAGSSRLPCLQALGLQALASPRPLIQNRNIIAIIIAIADQGMMIPATHIINFVAGERVFAPPSYLRLGSGETLGTIMTEDIARLP
jgi:hypothetical protein